ncbi:hypothetical protein DL98DRAFT_583729 [Cadophora sp. DSE1049]|nr:hypothetical protein DL98DRAFT_583729 [Cadophora sp. DSE1049]
MKYTGIQAMLNFLMLSPALFTTAAPTSSNSETPSTLDIINSPTPDTSTINSRSPYGIDYMQLGDNGFQPCFPNPQQANMCTVTLISHPTWNNEVQLFIYDNECKRIGENYHVPRDMLAAKWGWGMSSELPKYLVISISRDWEPSPSKDKGVKLDYGDAHFKPFFNNKLPFDDSFTVKGHVGDYTFFRAVFPRKWFLDIVLDMEMVMLFTRWLGISSGTMKGMIARSVV